MGKPWFFIISVIIILSLLLIYGYFWTHKINLVTADLGRHIKNGEVFFQNYQPQITNYYSYTQADYQSINHHWGAGVIFYLLWKSTGFIGLQLFAIALSLLSFFICLKIAKSKAGIGIAAFIALLNFPLLAERTEIRPEIFSYFFAILFFYVLVQVQDDKLSEKFLFLLPLLEIFWVNLHIYFFLGPVLIGVFWIESLIQGSLGRKIFKISILSVVLFLTAFAAFLNPFGVEGATAPLKILQNYGYRLVENQPVWFIEKLISNPNFLIFKIAFVVLLTSLIFGIWKQRRNFSISSALLVVGFSTAAWYQIRNFTMFGYFAIPLLASSIGNLYLEKFKKFAASLLLIILVIIASGNFPPFFPYFHEFGFGLEKNNSQAADFFKLQNLSGPIFNNYDIGSYLIFHLFPKERVFVDQRPEAYSVSFFQDTYIPMQEDDNKWKQIDKLYNFNSIFFSINDATPWGQKFLVNRVQDANWAPVYVDGYAIIFLKRSEQNRPVIEKYEIPKDAFRIISTAS